MKKTTVLVSIALCLVILISAIPINAFAAAIYGIGLTFDTDIHGTALEDYREFITIDYGEVSFYSKNNTLPVTAKPLDGSAFTGTFEGGKTYEVTITFAPKTTSYYFMSSLPNGISFNNESVTYKSHTITLNQFGTDYVTVVADVTVDEQTVFEKISDFFASFFDSIKEFFSELFSF